MSLNFYSEIDSLQVTNKDEVVIKIKTSGSNLDKQIDELRTLKNDGAVRIMIESAIVHYTVQKDIETGEDVTTNEDYKNKESIYKVGNVIEYRGEIYLVCETPLALGERKYFLVSLKTSKVSSLMFKTLEKLEENIRSVSDRLVKAKLTVDYKLDGDE